MNRLSKEELEMFPDTLKYGSLVQKRNMSEADVDILLLESISDLSALIFSGTNK